MKPYYEHAGITIYHGDCREVLPSLWLGVDLILTDPPYPDQYVNEYKYADGLVEVLDMWSCRQFVFWSAKAAFPLKYSAIHIWDKKTGCGSEYERIFERNGGRNWKVFRQYLINSTVAASLTGDVFTGHPSQKPLRLLRAILSYSSPKHLVLDPFMGSGGTLAAAKAVGLSAIGIEIEERYCEIAAKRLSQEVLPLEPTA